MRFVTIRKRRYINELCYVMLRQGWKRNAQNDNEYDNVKANYIFMTTTKNRAYDMDKIRDFCGECRYIDNEDQFACPWSWHGADIRVC